MLSINSKLSLSEPSLVRYCAFYFILNALKTTVDKLILATRNSLWDNIVQICSNSAIEVSPLQNDLFAAIKIN